jgi:uncharacterized protein (DUF2147 family)
MTGQRRRREFQAVGVALAAAVTAVVFALAPASARESRAPIDGLWLTAQADARIRISPCGAARCGTIIGLKQPIDPKTGKPVTDTNNPDPRKRLRPLIGLTILDGLKPVAGSEAWKGHVYNSDNGKIYDVTLTPKGADRLRIEGCLLVFCSGETWQRIGR